MADEKEKEKKNAAPSGTEAGAPEAKAPEKTENTAREPEKKSTFTEGGAKGSPAVNKEKKRRRRKRNARFLTIALLALAAVGGYFGWQKYQESKNADVSPEVMTDFVGRGSITSKVEGSGVATAKNSESITLLAGGDVLDVYVSEGDQVTAGTPLYVIESRDAQDRVNDAQKSVNNYQKELNKLYEDANDLNVRADYAGFLTDVQKFQVGERVAKSETVAKLVDDSQMLLTLYFSYAYENDVTEGQSAVISIPATMAQVPGTVKEVRMVQRISPEGSRLFAVVFQMDNPGVLTENMTATATLESDGEMVYPYEPGKLEYVRTMEIRTKVSGEVAWTGLYDYARVAAGDSVLTLTGDDTEAELATLENQLRSAQKTLDEAQKALDSLRGVAGIDGTVLTVGVTVGEAAKTGTVAVSIADTNTMVINANIDEMNVSSVKAGMPVDITLWENQLTGVVESVSLVAKGENGVARFPAVIAVDNEEGLLMSGANVEYSLVASQSEDCLMVPIQSVKSMPGPDGETIRVVFVRAEEPPENAAELTAPVDDIPAGFWPVEVEIGISDNYNAEILSGLEEGTEIYVGKAVSEDMGMMF